MDFHLLDVSSAFPCVYIKVATNWTCMSVVLQLIAPMWTRLLCSSPAVGSLLPLHPGFHSTVSTHLGPVQKHPPVFSESLHVDAPRLPPTTSHRSWVPASFILGPHLITDFHQQHQDQPAKAASSFRDPHLRWFHASLSRCEGLPLHRFFKHGFFEMSLNLTSQHLLELFFSGTHFRTINRLDMCAYEAFRGEFLPACNNYCFHCLMRHKLTTAEVKSRF